MMRIVAALLLTTVVVSADIASQVQSQLRGRQRLLQSAQRGADALGALNAGENANENALENANENSVLSGAQTVAPTLAGTVGSTVVPSTDMPSTEVPSTDVPSTDVPSTDVPSTDVPSTDVPSTDVPSTDAPTTETPPPSTETVAPTEETADLTFTSSPTTADATASPTESPIDNTVLTGDKDGEEAIDYPDYFQTGFGGTYQIDSELEYHFWAGKGYDPDQTQQTKLIWAAQKTFSKILKDKFPDDFESITECTLTHSYNAETEILDLHFYADVKLKDGSAETEHSVGYALSQGDWHAYLDEIRKAGLVRGGEVDYTATGPNKDPNAVQNGGGRRILGQARAVLP
ncbi:expressed unknown protein [Seminavis robusta]|uniref:Uncharacterized protein n=1 Tax=Seminavis robusta TaxID=568900 RepID=A0A9N8DZ81_9STRA|nr:expressed unknown protein [Seminavis robusta]|eukprot:Sro393_g133550.1 n/a (347) ;mRNA; r:16768-17808